jgi:hypothetical protein
MLGDEHHIHATEPLHSAYCYNKHLATQHSSEGYSRLFLVGHKCALLGTLATDKCSNSAAVNRDSLSVVAIVYRWVIAQHGTLGRHGTLVGSILGWQHPSGFGKGSYAENWSAQHSRTCRFRSAWLASSELGPFLMSGTRGQEALAREGKQNTPRRHSHQQTLTLYGPRAAIYF